MNEIDPQFSLDERELYYFGSKKNPIVQDVNETIGLSNKKNQINKKSLSKRVKKHSLSAEVGVVAFSTTAMSFAVSLGTVIFFGWSIWPVFIIPLILLALVLIIGYFTSDPENLPNNNPLDKNIQ